MPDTPARDTHTAAAKALQLPDRMKRTKKERAAGVCLGEIHG